MALSLEVHAQRPERYAWAGILHCSKNQIYLSLYLKISAFKVLLFFLLAVLLDIFDLLSIYFKVFISIWLPKRAQF
jgi:hypothetical protein